MTEKTMKKPAKKTVAKAPVKLSAKKAPVKVVESSATKARKKKDNNTITLVQPEIKPVKKEVRKDSTSPNTYNFNWHLQHVINENWAYAHNMFTKEECEQIIAIGSSGKDATPLTYGMTGDMAVSENNIEIVGKVRKSPIAWIRSDVEENVWIFQRLTDYITNINQQFFGYELTEIQSLQFTSYDGKENGFYGKHIDMMYKGNATRKLSVSVQLSDPSDYEGGNLVLHTSEAGEHPHKQQGTGIFFPGYTLHEVKPVTKGKRYSLVAWVLGPRFK
jgi:PKHD-type hydroxylase